MRTGTTDMLEILPTLHSYMFDYVLIGNVLIHFISAVALLLQVAVLLKAAQWFFYP
jgi:hypothetical protein